MSLLTPILFLGMIFNGHAQFGSRYGEIRPNHAKIVAERMDKDVRLWAANFIPKDPWRIFGGKTNYFSGTSGYQFSGRVISVSTNGVVLEGLAGVPCSLIKFKARTERMTLLHFTHPVSIGQILTLDEKWVAVSFNESNILDYGAVATPPGSKP